MTFKCVHCRSTEAKNTLTTKEFNIKNKVLVVQNIPAIECSICHEKFYDKEASEYIDHQIEIFEAEGLENKSKQIVKSKGITQERLGHLLIMDYISPSLMMTGSKTNRIKMVIRWG
jgi:YgiT-type zinc finger domain-containing protein